jgi:hypothetical protein
MLRNKLVRSDGSVIDSSVIISCEFTEEVNSGENLSVGNVTASEINLEVLSTDVVEQDEVLTYYIIEDGVETLIGVFNAEKPTVASRTSIKFSAYDNIVKSEKIFSDWLRNNQSLFPMTLGALVTHACEYCGLTLATTEFPQSEIEINAFYADGITCRQILSWASAIAGRFVRANSTGEIEFAWYEDATNIAIAPSAAEAVTTLNVRDDGAGNVNVMGDTTTVTDDGQGNVGVEIPGVTALYNSGVVSLAPAVSLAYKYGGLSYEAYSTDLINRVQIKQTDDDIGVIYPEDATGNCFVIRENMLLATCDTDVITRVAISLYNQLSAISYVPAKVALLRTITVRAGDIIRIQASNGTEIVTYVMKMSVAPSGTDIESTGNKSYESNAAVSSEKYKNMVGKILEIKKSIDGLMVKNEDLSGKVGSLELSTSEFKTYVGETFVSEDEFGAYQQSVSTEFSQTKNSFEMKFESTSKEISDVDKDLQDKYNERTSYIRFEDGNIILGRSDSDILLIQKNNRISFVRNVSGLPEVAWFADDILYVTEGQFLTQLRIGKFGFVPGANGNLSFRKVVT